MSGEPQQGTEGEEPTSMPGVLAGVGVGLHAGPQPEHDLEHTVVAGADPTRAAPLPDDVVETGARGPASREQEAFAATPTSVRLAIPRGGPPQAARGGARSRRRVALGTLVALVTLASLLGLLANLGRSFGVLTLSQPTSLVPPAALAPTATPQVVGQLGTPGAALENSPQGCVNGLPPVIAPQPAPIRSVRGLPGVGNDVALTFDDGPSPLYTPQIIAALREGGAHATFFVVGRHIKAYPGLVRTEWLGGNAIGNHTFLHEYVPGLRPDQLHASLSKTADAIRAETGDPCLWLFRPPYGDLALSSTAVTAIQHEGYTSVNWDVRAQDWLRPGTDVIAQRVIDQLHPGAVILLHDSAPDNEDPNRSQTAAALPKILAAIRARGLRTVTLPQLFADAGMSHPAIAPHVPAAPNPQHPPQPTCQPPAATLSDADVQRAGQTGCSRA